MKKNKSKNNIKSLGPYSQTRILNNCLFMSGQIGIDPQSGKLVSHNFDDQLKQILQNIIMILEESGSCTELAFEVQQVRIFPSGLEERCSQGRAQKVSDIIAIP